MFAKTNEILYLAQNDESEKKINPINISRKSIENTGFDTTDSIKILSKDECRNKKGGEYYASKRAIEFLKLFENVNISMISCFFIAFTFISAICFYMLYTIQIERVFLGLNLKFLAKIWIFLNVLTLFYKYAYQVAVLLGLSTAENTLFIQLLNTFAYLTSRIFDSILPGVLYETFTQNIKYIIYQLGTHLIIFMESFEICFTLITIISIFLPWFSFAMLAYIALMFLLQVFFLEICLFKYHSGLYLSKNITKISI